MSSWISAARLSQSRGSLPWYTSTDKYFFEGFQEKNELRKNNACRGVCWGYIIDVAVAYPDGLMEVGQDIIGNKNDEEDEEEVEEVGSYDSSKDEEDSPPPKRNKL